MKKIAYLTIFLGTISGCFVYSMEEGSGDQLQFTATTGNPKEEGDSEREPVSSLEGKVHQLSARVSKLETQVGNLIAVAEAKKKAEDRALVAELEPCDCCVIL